MSQTTIIKHQCDRCGDTIVREDAVAPDDWGRFIANAREGRFASPRDLYDLCASCLASLGDWFASPAGETPPPPAAPPVPPPAWSLVDRRAAIAIATEVLTQRAHYAVSVLREAPTEILSGQVVPGTLFGIDATATKLVDDVIETLGVGRAKRRRARGAAES